MSNKAACIYGLYDSLGNLLYVGKANDPAKRLKSHLRDAWRRNTPLYSWIRKHGAPEMRILEENCTDWREAERRIIKQARAKHDRLLNLAHGGDQPYCPPDVCAANGRATAHAIHGDKKRKRLWSLYQKLGILLREGAVSQATRGKMKSRPDLFGKWAHLL